MKTQKRPAPGQPPVSDKRINRSFKASGAEWEAIKEGAEKAGLNISQYIRERCLKQK